MKSEIIKITPAMAKEMLSRNFTGNRTLRTEYVLFLANEMLNGRWKDTAYDPVRFDRKGTLIDGQHRLSAVVKSSKAFRFMVYTDMDSDLFQVFDTGKNRTAGDTLGFAGIGNATQVSASIKMFITLKMGLIGFGAGLKAMGVSNAMILDEFKKDPEFWGEMNRAGSRNYGAFQHVISLSVLVGTRAYLNRVSRYKDKIEDFFDQLCSGKGAGDAIASLRSKLIADRMQTTGKFTSGYKVGLILKHWNSFAKNDKLKRITYDPAKEGKIVPL